MSKKIGAKTSTKSNKSPVILRSSGGLPAQLDVIVPVFNESGAVTSLVKRLYSVFTQENISFRLLFVDDRSTDDTVKKLQRLQKKFPLIVLEKQGKQGKAYSILEATQHLTAPYVGMIDADLQYPPEALPAMLRLTQQFGVVVAKRTKSPESWYRKVASRGFQWFFGHVLHGLDCDVQSGQKVFKREILEYIQSDDISPWTIDIPLLTTALDLGYQIGEVEIEYAQRKSGQSKIKLVSSIREIGGQAIKYKLKRKNPFVIAPTDNATMLGAGVTYRRHRFVTHSTLAPSSSALKVVERSQKVFILTLVALSILCIVANPLATLQVFVALLSLIYFVDVFFNLFLVTKSLHHAPEIDIAEDRLVSLSDASLPTYTILCPLYKEAHVLPQFIAAIEKMDWPKKKLDVQLLLESDDTATIDAARAMKLPAYVHIQVVPDSQPKTKPKACNYGLNCAQGEYLVVFDAEDVPDPMQLKKVYLAFQQSTSDVMCIQAKLNFYNPNQNLLTRFFTAEYSLWFDLSLTGLQSVETTIPLGGTSNHFRTKDLLRLEGWDPFNVTEDCDLGVRLFKQGGRTAIINSTTYEEANSDWGNWLRQRSRWIKGYMQTYLVHMRHPITFFREQGWHAMFFQLTVGGKIAFMLINPIMWLLTISYFALYAWVGPTIETLYPSTIFYMAVVSLIFGNFLFLYYYMIGAAKREQWSIIKWVFLVPFYWLLVSVAAAIALYQLIFKPHYWEKTVHGLHLKAEAVHEQVKTAVVTVETVGAVEEKEGRLTQLRSFRAGAAMAALRQTMRQFSFRQTMTHLFVGKYRGGTLLVLASVLANVINMLTNIVSGHLLRLSDFGVMNTFVSLVYLVGIPLSALSVTMNHQTSFLMGKHWVSSLAVFWRKIRKKALLVSVVCAVVWIGISPWLANYLNTPTILPILVFAPIWILGTVGAIDRGYVKGRMLFEILAVVTVVEVVARLVFTVLLALTDNGQYAYISIPLSAVITFVAIYLYVRKDSDTHSFASEFTLPKTFFAVSLLAGLSSIAFFSLDNIFVAHYLGVVEAGKYALIGLVGKMIFFTGGLTSIFIIPVISHSAGKGENSNALFRKLLLLTLVLTGLGYVVFALGISVAAPYFFGVKMAAIRGYLPIYGLGIALFTVSQVFVSYHLAKREYIVPAMAFVISLFQIVALMLFHQNLNDFVMVMSMTGLVNCVVLYFIHRNINRLKVPLNNVVDFLDLFKLRQPRVAQPVSLSSLRILIFNWRDTRHLWSGGAEVYVQSIAEELVMKGHKATIFCGNDGKCPRNEVVNGVQIVRRGGFYTVYFWGMVYYLLRFRGLFDVVIDSENGVPFLTPLYVRAPIFLLIHHVHQEVFREHLSAPLSLIARTIEAQVMPFLYKSHQILTVSESSRDEIIKLGLGTQESIQIITPGLSLQIHKKYKKTPFPSLCYIGRLKPYKNVDTAVQAFANIAAEFPLATFTIAGFGESEKGLKTLVTQLHLKDRVTFLGKISETEKIALFSRSWAAVQPSMIEGWGITVIEANACKTPVIASNVKGLRDSVVDGETGILVAPRNVDDCAIALKILLENSRLRKRYSRNALKWSRQFEWSISAQKLEELLSYSIKEQVYSDNNPQFELTAK